jgi:hypothetical protein
LWNNNLYKEYVCIISIFIADLYLVVAFSLRSFLEGEGQVKVDPLPSATATKLLQETGISVFLQTTQCDHSTLPFTTSTGRLNNGRLLI